jgi:sec-independent protein translocase protein TatB
MLPDIGGTELLVIAAVALIVVGPKDLPVLLRKLGQFIGKMRGMASEFRASFDEMARQSELDELRREVQAMRAGQYAAPVQPASPEPVDQTFADIDASLSSGAMQMHPYAGAEIHSPAPEPSILPPTPTPAPAAEIVEAKPKRAPRKKAEPVLAEPAKAPRKRAASQKDVTVEAPKAVRAPRKKPAKAGGSTASDIVS